MNITLNDNQRRTLLGLLRRTSAAGTRLPQKSPALELVLDVLDTPIDTPEKAYTLPVDVHTAGEINSRLYTHLGFLMEADEQNNAHPQVVAQRLVYKAIEDTFPTYQIIGYVRKKTATTPPQPTVSQSVDATLCIVSEIDGDITGYFVLTDTIIAAMDASNQDAFGYLVDPKNNPPIMHQTLVEALKDIEAQGLVLKNDFGCCAY